MPIWRTVAVISVLTLQICVLGECVQSDGPSKLYDGTDALICPLLVREHIISQSWYIAWIQKNGQLWQS